MYPSYRIIFTAFFVLFLSVITVSATETATISNSYLSRTATVDENGVLRTSEIVNKIANQSWKPKMSDTPEFRLRISRGTQFVEGDRYLTSADFVCRGTEKKENADGSEFVAKLENQEFGLTVTVHYTVRNADFYAHKWLKIETKTEPITLEYIELEAIPAVDALQPYQKREIYMNGGGQWRPGLGQPLYTTQTATFWGVEFPAACNVVENGKLQCAYQWGFELKPGTVYTTHKAVWGVGDDPKFMKDTFLEYIDRIRIRPARLQVQYNSWFDVSRGVSKENFAQAVETIHQKLVTERKCPPLTAYVIDDGWQRNTDLIGHAFPVNHKFDADFASTFAKVHECGSDLGLWLSPACIFGCREMVAEYEKAGYESFTMGMSMCGPKYMADFEARMLELTKMGVTFFKLDGIFGHLNVRNIELLGRGCPAMPQLETEGFSNGDKRLNDVKYDELKIYYLSASAERLCEIFRKQHEINPEVYIVISNAAWLSPWWLQYVDTCWMINAGDAASGSTRSQELTYRDGVYFSIVNEDQTQFPLVSIFNHEPKKNTAGEDPQEFRKYLFMHLSRGSGFLEMYLRPRVLVDSDWDVLSEGIAWAHEIFPTFKNAHYHGGDPRRSEAYGYSGWDQKRLGYLSVHNPSNKVVEYTVTLDRALGMVPDAETVYTSKMVFGENKGDVPETHRFGDVITLKLEPEEVRVIQFSGKE